MESKKPPRLYSVLFSQWALGFWVVMFLGALHGLVKKGPLMLRENWEIWEKTGNLGVWHWTLLACIIIFFSYCEGYRGFQLAWSPMLVKRAYHFSCVSTPIYDWTTNIYLDRVIDFMLAPILAGGFICGTRRRLYLSWGITIFVLMVVVLMRYMSDNLPYKCFVDIGVVIGLGWGLFFILVWWFKIGILNTWPDWVKNEYPSNLSVKIPDNVLIKSKKRSSRTSSDNENSLTEVISVLY